MSFFFNPGREFPFGGRECSGTFSPFSAGTFSPAVKKKVNRISCLKSWEGKEVQDSVHADNGTQVNNFPKKRKYNVSYSKAYLVEFIM